MFLSLHFAFVVTTCLVENPGPVIELCYLLSLDILLLYSVLAITSGFAITFVSVITYAA
jgi:hypothetical protein